MGGKGGWRVISQTKFKRVFSGMTTLAQKVYNFVPISETWAIGKVCAEAKRNGVTVDQRVMFGCLAALRDGGLVDEPVRGEFRRHPVRVAPEKLTIPVFTETTPQEEPMVKPQAQPVTPGITVTITEKKKPAPTPMDMLGDLAQRAVVLADMVKALAEDISDTAVEVQAQFEASAEESKKLKQLKALLGSIGGE